MLTIWTSANGPQVSKVFAPALRSFRPDVPPHKFLTLEGGLVTPEAGEVVLVCGNKTLDELRKAGIVHKSRTLSGLREKPVAKPGGGHWLVTYDPAITGTEFDKREVIEWDVQLAARLLRTGSVEPKLGMYTYVSNYDETIDYIETQFAKTGKPVDVTLDLETMGFHPWYPDRDIITCSFTAIPETAHVIYVGTKQKHPVELDKTGKLFEQIKWLLNSPKVKLKGANLKFDLIWIAVKWGIECTNFVFDTLLVGTLVNENRSNSLNLQAKVMTALGGYDDFLNQTTDKGHMELVPPAKLLPYAGGDTDACLRVANVLKTELTQDAALTKFYITILHPAARAFEKIERRGVVVDRHKYELLRDELKKTIDEGQKKQLSLLPAKLRVKHRDKISEQLAAGKSPLTPTILKEFFFSPQGLNLKPKEFTPKSTPENPNPSLAKSHLRQFAGGNYEATLFVEAMTETDSAAKTLSTFVEGFLRHLRPDGRLHPNYMLFRGDRENDEDDDDSGTVCVTADTLFTTDRGVIPFMELKVGDHAISHLGVGRPIVALVNNGVKPAFKVRLSNGGAITCTGNHPFRIASTWVRADRLQAGQDVAVLPETESWKEIEGWPFWVSTWGRVRSAKGTFLQQYRKGAWGHLKVCLFRNGAQKRGPDRRDFPVHRLVAEAFVPHDGELPEVRHKNGIAWDNRTSNLVWGTAADNRRDMRMHGTGQGAHGSQAKVDWEAVAHMRACSQSDKELAAQYGVSRELVRDIRANKKWLVRAPAERSVQFATAKVVSVTYVGDLPTFGATVADDHSHVTNGIVTHNTGRLSAKDPAFQTLPKKTKWAKRIRACYPAPPGKKIISCDYSQGELRVVACVAPENTMIAAYKDGLDLHAVTGAKLANVAISEFLAWKDSEDKALSELYDKHRGNAKPANFGLLYGMQVDGFRTYAWANYGIKLTYEEAENMRNAFFELYPGLLDYHDVQKKLVWAAEEVRSPLGRIRHLPMIRSYDREIKSRAERQAINSPIQSCLSDMMLWAIAEIDRAYPNGEIEVVGMVHDALIAYIDAGTVDTLVPQVVEIMSNLPLQEVGWKPQLKFTVDAEAGPDLASLKKLKFAV